MKQANTKSEEELDEILDNITEFLYFKNADGEFVPVNFKNSPVFKEDRDALLAWRDAAVVEAEKTMADNLIDQEARLYKIFSDDDKICVGIKKMADEVREYYGVRPRSHQRAGRQ